MFVGAKCRARTPSARCKGRALAFSLSAVQRVLRLRQLRCWVVPGRDSSSSASSVRRVPALHSAVEFNLAAIPPHLCRGEPRQKCSGHPGHGRPGRWRRLCPSSSRRSPAFASILLPSCPPQTARYPRSSGVVSCFYSKASASSRGPSSPARAPVLAHSFGLFQPRAVRPSACRTLCRSLPGSGSLRSPSPCTVKARQPQPCQTASRPNPPLRSGALVI